MAAIGHYCVRILLIFVCFRSTVAALRDDKLQQQYGVVVDELADLKKTVMQLTEDMKVMKKISKALTNLCVELQLPDTTEPDVQEPTHSVGDGTKEVQEEHDKEKNEDIKQNEGNDLTSGLFQINSLEITNGTFQIKYDGSVREEVISMDRETPVLNRASMETERLISISKGLITGPVTSGDNYVSIISGDFAAAVSFKSDNQTHSKINLKPQTMKSDVQKNIIFETGHTTEFKVNVSKSENETNHFDLGLYTPLKDGIVILAMTEYPGIVNITTREEHPEYTEVFISINGDKEDHEGLLYLSSSKYRVDFKGLDHLFYNVFQMLEVRRSDHKDPFELGYIGFTKTDLQSHFHVRCTIGTICPLRTELVGNMPDDVTLWKILDWKKTQLELPRNRREFGRFILSVIFYLPNPLKEDEGRYLFKGTSHNGTVIEREFEVAVYS